MCSVFPVPLVLSGNPFAGFHVWMEKTDSTWCSWRISTKFLCPWSTAVPKEETLSTRFQRRRRCQLACCVSWKVLCPTPQTLYLCLTGNSGDFPPHLHPKTLFEMWITCLDRVSANSEKGRGSEWAVRVGQRLHLRFGQSGAVRELNLVQIVEEVSAIRGGLPST